MSLYAWDGVTSPEWAGAANYRNILLNDDIFWKALSNNLFIISVPSFFIICLSLFYAYLLNRKVMGKSVFQVAFFFPNIINVVAIALLWTFIYNPQGGILNGILASLSSLFGDGCFVGRELARLRTFPWLAAANLYIAIVPIMVWASTGFYIILFLAGMENVPASLYEAAEIDGASQFQTFRHVTFPMLWEVIVTGVIFLTIAGIKMFDLVWILSNQWVTSDNHVMATHMIQRAFKELRFGEGTAIAVILFCIVVGATAVFKRFSERSYLA
jgi:ABC-type sugar transport system permease subunit